MSKKINYYVAVYIDILGQGEKLSKIKKLPDTEEEKKKFFDFFRETVGAVKELHSSFDEFFKAYNKISPDMKAFIETHPEEIQEQYYKSRKYDLKSLRFSDTIILCFTLDSESTSAPIHSIYTVLSSAASSFVILLSQGMPLRGAISIGIATELDDSGIYGSILHNLHYLESKKAEYPRIIVGDELVQMVNGFEAQSVTSKDIFGNMNKAMIPRIKRLIKRSDDGLHILNYLDKGIADSLKDKRKVVYDNLNSFVKKQLSACKDSEKLLSRYRQLNNFVRRNKNGWL